jgi:hypothetical protein
LSDKKIKKKGFPDIYERLLPIILIFMAIIVLAVLVFAMIVGLGIV